MPGENSVLRCGQRVDSDSGPPQGPRRNSAVRLQPDQARGLHRIGRRGRRRPSAGRRGPCIAARADRVPKLRRGESARLCNAKSAVSINFASMANPKDKHEQRGVVDGVEDAVVADTDTENGTVTL